MLNKNSDNSMEEEVNVEAECKNCNREIRLVKLEQEQLEQLQHGEKL